MEFPEILNYKEYAVIKFEEPMFAISSSMINPGFTKAFYFVNRTVSKDYYPTNPNEEYRQFLIEHNIPVEKTVAMMTAVSQQFLISDTYQEEDFTVSFMITAGLSNAVDITTSHQYCYEQNIGTINIFVFIDGHLSKEAMMQAFSAVVETKVKILLNKKIYDKKSGTIATGTSTDSICVAATQKGLYFPYAGSITKIGSSIGKYLSKSLTRAIDQYLLFTEGKKYE